MKKVFKEILLLCTTILIALFLEFVFFCGIYHDVALFSPESLSFFSLARVLAVLIIVYGFRFLTRIQKAVDFSLETAGKTDIEMRRAGH